eukprot:gnl/MRDRNA2_/MRDRNA2_30973_c0_seq1.p1 gnl/MRDRNA2_/MRDRNA2_30973_c0~~gnl/MRDRNA2_/MRDRNA2_30973_c0_seq1.p1  ORF type:complete len:539 (-),score=92.46 gnl/MRDRNA2_/MRDRNA2_30973_c0_seq1:289-1905(-)
MMLRPMVLLPLWSSIRLLYALDLTVNVHYPEKMSAVELCGFKFSVEAVSKLNPTDPIAHAHANKLEKDLYSAYMQVPDENINSEAILAVMAKPGGTEKIWSPECQQICPRLGPQGFVTNAGPFTKTGPLQKSNVIDLWPDFGCQGWSNVDVSFHSKAIGRHVQARARVPASAIENTLARPTHLLPPTMFRFNAEWYWDHPVQEYDSWHKLMVDGEMEPVTMVELYIKGVGWQDWETQPIYSTEPLRKKCGKCDPELQFICDDWEKTGYNLYKGGHHSFGHAKAFFEELYREIVPALFKVLPGGSHSVSALRTGVWGNCIGGLAAWNAVSSLPHLFNIAYLGSPAVDYDCGDGFKAVQNISLQSQGSLPRIYIDSGADEGPEMNQQALLLFSKLQQQGLIEGQNVYYTRHPFGTHQGRMFERRVLKALMTLFGTNVNHPGSSYYFTNLKYSSAMMYLTQSTQLDAKVNRQSERAENTMLDVLDTDHALHISDSAIVGAFFASIAVSFIGGMWVMRCATAKRGVSAHGREPLVGSQYRIL